MARIGVFWVFRGKVLAATRFEVAEGVQAGGMVDGPQDHANYWPILQRSNPALAKFEYFEVPRGRVVWNRKTSTAMVYMNKLLFKPAVRTAIREQFGLSRSKTRFVRDVHYTTDVVELDRLFES